MLEALQAHGSDFLRGASGSLLARGAGGPGTHVLLDGHGRKEGVALEEVANATLLRRQVDVRVGIEERATPQHDAARVRPLDAGDALERHRLAAARGAEKRHDLCWALDGKRDLQREGIETLGDVDFERRHAATSLVRAERERASSMFMARSTTALIARFTRTHWNASPSSPVRQS